MRELPPQVGSATGASPGGHSNRQNVEKVFPFSDPVIWVLTVRAIFWGNLRGVEPQF